MADSIKNSFLPNQDGALPAPFLSRRAIRWLVLIPILWLSLWLRVWQLDILPPGLHYDEAFNGHLARDVLRDVERPIFFTDNFGEEPMHMYTEALLFEFLPELPWTIRLTSAIYGVLLVVAVYACARAFFPQSDVAALSGAFIAATLYWAINFSRIGIETNSLPFPLTLSAAALAYAYRKMSWRWVAGAGFLVGASIYTYLASRLWLVAVALWFVYLVILHTRFVRAHFIKWVGIGLVALLTLAPLILFFVQNPVAFTGRSGTVFTPETLVTNLVRTAGMFSFAGDTDPRDNLIARPALDVLLSILGGIGLIVSLVRFKRPFYALLVIWLVIMCLPSAVTEFAPNFRRAIGALPATVLLCGVGFDWLWTRRIGLKMVARPDPLPSAEGLAGARGASFIFRSPAGSFLPKLVLVCALVVSAFWSARAYFVEWASTDLYYSFDAGLLQLGKTLAARPANEDLYLSPNYAEHYTVAWALDGRPVASFDGRRIQVLADSSRAATYGIITREDPVTAPRLHADVPGIMPLTIIADASGTPYAEIYTQAPGAQRPVPAASAIRFGDFALLDDKIPRGSVQRGEDVSVELTWTVLKAAPRDYTVFVQLVGPPNPATGSIVWAQADRRPGGGTYPTDKWQSGELVRETFEIKVPPEALPGTYKILVGMYQLETNQRVTLSTAHGGPIQDDAVVMDSFDLP